MPYFKRASRLILAVSLCAFLDSCGKPSSPSQAQLELSPPFDTLVLKNGGVIQGKIVKESADEVSIRWQDGVIGFKRSEIGEIKRGDVVAQGEGGIVIPKGEAVEADRFDPKTYPRVYLTNGKVKKGAKVTKEGTTYLVGEPVEGGGFIEFTLPAGDIEKIELWPPPEYEIKEAVRDLRKKYPALLSVIEKPYHVILSDDDPIDLDLYLNTVEQFYYEFILHFFDLIRPDYKPFPLQQIILGTRAGFQEMCRVMGFPYRPGMLGFYVDQWRILFLYNIKGEEMTMAYLYGSEAVEKEIKDKVREFRETEDDSVDEIEKSRALGAADMLSDFLEKNRLRVEREAREETIRTIRHEGGHQLLYEFGIHAKNTRQGAWLVEGLASYCEPPEIGDIHEARLMELKLDLEKHHLMPLEYLLSLAAGGDLHRLEASYASVAYAQSWALVHFLMSGPYREDFLNYVKEIPKQSRDFDEKKDVALLEKFLGKPVPEIEKEFDPYVKQMIADGVDEEKYEEFRLRMILAR